MLCKIVQLPQQLQNRYSEPDNRDWRGRSGQPPASPDERSWENLRDNSSQGNHQDHLNLQFARTQISSTQGVSIGRNKSVYKKMLNHFLIYLFSSQ